MEINNIDSLKSALVNNVNNGEKISFVFGAGISINTNKDGEKPNGIGLASEFIELFKETIRTKKTPNERRIDIPEKNFKEFEKTLKISNNKYSTYAKFFEKECDIDVGKEFFKPIISEIKGFEEIADIKEEKRIYEFLDDIQKLQKIELNPALTSLGKLLPLINDDIKIYTSNIDPFIEIVAQRNGKKARSIHYHYEKKNSKKINSHKFVVEHFHGYWLDRSLHENLERKGNTISFTEEINNTKNLFIIGYDGWNDAMLNAIKDYLKYSENHKCTIHWAYYSDDEEIIKQSEIYKLFNKDSKQYLKLYKGIDANKLFKTVYNDTLKKSLETYLDDSIKQVDTDSNISFNKVPYKYSSTFTSRLNGKSTNSNIISFVCNKFLMNKKVGISSKFGLGKTTLLKEISNHIIATKEKLPININLRDKQLSKINKLEIYNLVYDEIIITIRSNSNPIDFEKFATNNKKEIVKIIKDKLLKNELVLILDGIDESNYRNNEFKLIIENLKKIEHPFIFSFRTEFHKLLDCFIDNSNELKGKFISVELKEWDTESSHEYIEQIFNDTKTINKLKEQYPTLLRRPIFLNLLKVIQSDTNKININDNISDLFYNFLATSINSKLDLFIKENKLNVSKEILSKEIYDLIVEISISLYLEYRHFIEKSNNTFIPKISFSKETLRLIVAKYKFLNPDLFIKFIEFSEKTKEFSLFKKQNGDYTFFHRSLFDYLVANGAAKSIIRNGKCSNAWNVYQTDEISEYFVNELKNIKNASDSKEKEVIKDNVISAFEKELLVLNTFTKENLKKQKKERDKKISKLENSSEEDILDIYAEYRLLIYSERLEEVIFYCGKYYPDNSITDKLELINDNKYFFPPKYFRTTAITLSRLYNKYGHPTDKGYLKNQPIYSYLARIFYDLTTPTRMFYRLQSSIDIEYYGKEELYSKSLKSVKNILLNNSVDDFNPLDLLKTFSFFLSLEIQSKTDYYKKSRLINELQSKNYIGNTKLFDNFIESLDFMFYRKTYFYRNNSLINNENNCLKKTLDIAIRKRKSNITKNNNVIRLFNGTGDGLDSLFIDYYNKHIVIQLDTKYLDNNIKIIQSSIIDILGGKLVNSINIKYTWWQNKRKSIPPDTVYGTLNNKIICNENNLKFYVDITDSKTGFFIDNRNIRNYIAKKSEGKRILNLCSFTATIGCVAKINKCKEIINLEKFNDNNELGKENYQLNSLVYQDYEFITKEVQKINEINFEEKFDIIILDFPEISVLPTFYDKSYNSYLYGNENVLELLKQGGILITTCCSHGFKRDRYNLMIDDLKKRNGLVEIENDLETLFDHPVVDRNDYLKIKILKKH